jgi:hypothetical protein
LLLCDKEKWIIFFELDFGGGQNVGWKHSTAIGRSGGIITLWDSNKESLVSSFQGQGFLRVCLDWGVQG